ncbi:hypothetical protein BC629DRAFT_1153055 [Irpex lacteus]|nr:hypothetical protein BC629DRAFT_1153055 [Irpex lacteus]
MEKHGIARKVRHTHSGECARPGCTRNLDTGVFFLERVIGRRPANLKVIPPEHPWLFKWADYSPREATWEPEASFPPGRDKFIAEFEDAALAAGLPFDDLDELILLPEAVEAGWPNINLNR